MSHIEFIGPPGAGKSTIYSQILKNEDKLVGKEDVINRIALSNSSHVFFSATKLLPQVASEKIFNFWYKMCMKDTYFNNFTDKNPDYQIVWGELSKKIKYEKLSLESVLNSTAAIYEAGTSVLQNNEILCLDEGFSQRLVSILWRSEYIETDMISRYYSMIPSPELVVYIKAPAKTCIERQRERGNVVVSKDWTHEDLGRTQQKIHDICDRIIHTAENHLEVLTIENESEIEDTMKEIDETLFLQ